MFEWMEAEYEKILALPPGSAKRDEKMESLRQRLKDFILRIKFHDDFKRRLASPFSKRAFAWRQSHMDLPQHVYASVLFMRSVPSEKSGVMVTRDIDTGEKGWLSVAVNEGVGGAVDGQAAESLRIHIKTGEVRLLAQATAPRRRVLKSTGGVDKELVEGSETVLKLVEIRQLISLAQDLPQRYPSILDAGENPAPADIEFGFVNSKLQLFQIRPFLESLQARSNEYLNDLDRDMSSQLNYSVKLIETPL